MYNNPKADELFRFYIKRARESLGQQGKEIEGYLPFNLSRLLEHMTLKQRRETIIGRIDETKYDNDRVKETIKNFMKLFIIDKGAADTLSRDEWSRKVSFAVRSRELKKAGEKFSV